jgi:hypothetical protein
MHTHTYRKDAPVRGTPVRLQFYISGNAVVLLVWSRSTATLLGVVFTHTLEYIVIDSVCI